MRRTLPLLVTATLLFAACSSSDDNASDNSAGETASTDEASNTSDADTDESGTAAGDTVAPPATNPDKPEVEVPAEIPTELIEEGHAVCVVMPPWHTPSEPARGW